MGVAKHTNLAVEVQLEPDSPVPLHHQLAVGIRDTLRKKRVKGGKALPSILSLAERLQLNRDTVRRAYGTLEAEGVVRRSPGGRILQITPEFAESYCRAFLPALGMVLPGLMADLLHQPGNPALEIVCGVMDTATQYGFAAMPVPLPESDPECERLEHWLKEMLSKLNGLIYLGENPDQTHQRAFELLLAEKDMPQVFVGGQAFRPHLGTVTFDYAIGYAAAAEHLHELGHRRVAVMAPRIPRRELFQLQTVDRAPCLVRTLEKYFTLRPEWLQTDIPRENAASSLHALLSGPDRPTAVFFVGDDLTSACLPVLGELGLRVPEDVSFVSHDDTNQAATHRPGWTAVRNPRRAAGKAALEMIVHARRENIAVADTNRTLATSLVIRQSTGRAPAL